MVTELYSFDPKSVVPLDKERQWADEFPGEWVLAYGADLLGHGETDEEAWRMARPEMSRRKLPIAAIQQFYFDEQPV